MVHLSNHVYIPRLASLSGSDVSAVLAKLFVYVLLELGSLFALDWTLRRKLRFSPTAQLAFVLETRWRSVQAELIPWIVYVVQTSLYHYGWSCCCAPVSFITRWSDLTPCGDYDGRRVRLQLPLRVARHDGRALS